MVGQSKQFILTATDIALLMAPFREFAITMANRVVDLDQREAHDVLRSIEHEAEVFVNAACLTTADERLQKYFDDMQGAIVMAAARRLARRNQRPAHRPPARSSRAQSEPSPDAPHQGPTLRLIRPTNRTPKGRGRP